MGSNQEKTEQLLDELHAGVLNLTDSDEWQDYLDFSAQFHDYSFRNQLLIKLQRPTATMVAGYRAWQKMGRQVQKGESGIGILAPLTRKVEVEPDECDRHDRCDGHERRYVYGFKTVYVFDIEQTEGEPVPELPISQLDGEAPADAWNLLAELVREEGFELGRGDTSPANGTTYFDRDHVDVAPDLSPAQATKTLAHELAHVVMHDPDEDDREYRTRELIECEAESVAYIIMRRFGIDASDYSFGYLASWSEGDEDKLEDTADRVVKAADELTERLVELVDGADLQTAA